MQKERTSTAKIFSPFIAKFAGAVFVTAILFLSLLGTGIPLAHAATIQPSYRVVKPDDPNCQLTSVTLHGTQAPTIQCLQSTNLNGGVLHPFTFPMKCNGSENLFLESTSSPTSPVYGTCFGGSGYAGVSVSHVIYSQYTYHNAKDGWMRAYDDLVPGGYWADMFPGQGDEYTSYTQVTQICLDCGYHS